MHIYKKSHYDVLLPSATNNNNQSAVKAKLIEMGTGGSAGYIDDELPDYVMIMVANKRSKQQMTDDLALFLGDNTAQFVDWLYLVLEKLQEVAMPASVAAAASAGAAAAGKSASGKSSAASGKLTGSSKETRRNDKKSSSSSSSSAGKRSRRDHNDDNGNDDGSLTPPPPPAHANHQTAVPSITDVFAEHLIQRARNNLDSAAASAKATVKHEDAFDIPTIAEMSTGGGGVQSSSRRREIAALADLQKKINEAKAQMSGAAAASEEDDDDDGDENDDDDFINLNDEEMGDGGAGHDENAGATASGSAAHAANRSAGADSGGDSKNRTSRVPITFREDKQHAGKVTTAVDATANGGAKAKSSASPALLSRSSSSVLDRLGVRPGKSAKEDYVAAVATFPPPVASVASRVHDTSSSSSSRRGEQSIYVPSFRRKESSSSAAQPSSHHSGSSSHTAERYSDRDRNPDRIHRDREHSSSSSSLLGRGRERGGGDRDRERERERERDLLRSRNPDRDSSSGMRDRNPDRSRERHTASGSHTSSSHHNSGGSTNTTSSSSANGSRLRDRLGAAVNNTLKSVAASSSASAGHGQRDLREQMRQRSGVRRRSNDRKSPPSSSASSVGAVSSSGASTASAAVRAVVESKVRVATGNNSGVSAAAAQQMPDIPPVNSVVKVKPRPVVPANRQACKSLLLRAMAEAQKSTALVKPRADDAKKVVAVVDLATASKPNLYTKSFRNKSNIVIQVAGNAEDDGHQRRRADGTFAESDDDLEVEYIMQNIAYEEIVDDTDDEALQRSQYADAEHVEEEQYDDEEGQQLDDDDAAHEVDGTGDGGSMSPEHRTQFVVTMDELKTKQYALRTSSKRLLRQAGGGTATPNGDTGSDGSGGGVSQRVNKLIIQNDTDDEEELRKEVERSKVKTAGVRSRRTATVVDAAAGGETEMQSHSADDEETEEQEMEHNAGTMDANDSMSPVGSDANAAVGETTAEIANDSPAEANEQRRKRRHVSPITFDRIGSATPPPPAGLDAKRKRALDGGPLLSRPDSDEIVDSIISRKYDHLPTRKYNDLHNTNSSLSLNAGVSFQTQSVDDALVPEHVHHHHAGAGAGLLTRSKERCKYYPNCSKLDSCEFTHPKKYENGYVPPYLSAYAGGNASTKYVLCRFHPNCTKLLCKFYHPKVCRFGRNCVNRTDCTFWHYDGGIAGIGGTAGTPSGNANAAVAVGKDKLKWFASSTVY